LLHQTVEANLKCLISGPVVILQCTAKLRLSLRQIC